MDHSLRRTVCTVLALLLAAACLTGCAPKAEEPLPEQLKPEPPERRETAHIHRYSTTVTEADCLTDGKTEYRCACGDLRITGEEAAWGHNYGEEVHAPTIAADGYTLHICAVCGDSYTDSPVPMLPDGIEDGSFFADAAFVGDSIVLSLRSHAQLTGCFGEMPFLCRASYSVRAAANHSMDLTYRGRAYPVAEALAACGAKKVFIELGTNDIGSRTADQSMEFWQIMIDEIRAQCPDILIFIQAATPIYVSYESFNNDRVDRYNEELRALAERNGCWFVDINTPLKGENGRLRPEFCSDQYVHLTLEACEVWERVLKDYLLEHKAEFADALCE